MACNLAVTIAKAAVASEIVQKLLTPDVIDAVVKEYLAAEFGCEVSSYRTYDGGVCFTIGNIMQLTISPGATRVQAYHFGQNLAAANELQAKVIDLLQQAGSLLLANQAQATMERLGMVQRDEVQVTDQGQIKTATVLTVRL